MQSNQPKETITLPSPIGRYFAADAARDMDALASCFTENAIVKDEGRTYTGRAAILDWKRNAGSQYDYTAEPFAIESSDERTIVTSHLVGNFPGSPVDLRYFFKFDAGRIAELEIVV